LQESGNELLNSFKYANFSINEEQDVAAAAQHQVASAQELEAEGAEWDAIIPESERQKLEEEERRKLAADLELAPRQRVKVEVQEDDGDASASEEEAESGGRKKRKKAFGDFSGTEVKRFVRSFRKFAHPLERLEALAQDAELEEHSAEELRKLAEALLEACEKAEEEHELKKNEVKADGEKAKERGGVIFKFAGVADVNIRPIRKLHAELEPLHKALSDKSSAADFRPPYKARAQKGWDVEWNTIDDKALLQGVYKYGLGSWEAIKMDPQLGLADKVFLKDKVRKPQPRHLQQRVDYLLKLMNKFANGAPAQKATSLNRKRKAPDDDQSKSGPVEEKKRREKEHVSSHHKHHHHKDAQAKAATAPRDKTLADQLALVLIEKSIYGQALEDTNDRPFSECVKMMRPVQKYIKKLTEAGSEKEAAKYLLRLGDNCRDQLDEMLKKKPKTNVRKWYNYMWIFLSKFVSQEPMEMLQKYRELCAVNHRHKHRDHNHSQKGDRTPHKNDVEKKDKEPDKKDSKEHKKKHHKEHKHDKEHREHKSHKPHEGHKVGELFG
ncbi:hypothetical protein OESDEN_23069, partial [Oesophagostomum dentatum]